MSERPSLTGDQVWSVRRALGETQKQFAERIDYTQVGVYHLENKRGDAISSRTSGIISRLASEHGITIPSADQAGADRAAASGKTEAVA